MIGAKVFAEFEHVNFGNARRDFADRVVDAVDLFTVRKLGAVVRSERVGEGDLAQTSAAFVSLAASREIG